MNKLALFCCIGFVLLYISSGCNSADAPESTPDEKQVIFNPNGDSELALLMRKMHDDLAAIKPKLKAGEYEPALFPEYLTELKTATPTNPEVSGDLFNAFADAYLATASNFYSEDANVHNYNEIITSCVNCHQEYCFGPIEKINKLRIKPKK